MPPPSPRQHAGRRAAADALLGVAPVTSRWMERLLAGHDPPLTLARYLALRAAGDGPVVAADLARRAGVSGPAVSQLVAGLVSDGLLERRPAESDRRRQELVVSKAGRELLRSVQALMAGRLAELLSGLPRPEADALSRALPQVEVLLSDTAPPRRPPASHRSPRGPRGPRSR